MQKVEITKRIADTGAMAIVRVQTVERGYEIAEGCLAGRCPYSYPMLSISMMVDAQ